MPGNHSEISVVEQSGGDDDDRRRARRRRKKKKKKHDDDDDDDDATGVGFTDDIGKRSQLAMPLISNSRKRFIAKMRKKPKSPSGSRKGGCFPVMRHSRRDGSSSPTSDPNDEGFTHEMLRVMIETNDFSSHDCNPHR